MKANLDELEDDENIFHNSLHDYYQIRPKDEEEEVIVIEDNKEGCGDDQKWEKKCLADFVAKFNISYKKDSNSIMLLDEKSYITERRRPCVIRYFLKYDNEEEYLRALCTLFLPFRNEIRDIHSKDLKKLYEENRQTIETNRQKYEKHKTLIDVIKETEERKEDDFDDLEESESQYIDEETTLEEEIEDFEKKMKAEAKRVLNNFSSSTGMMEEEEYLEIIDKLNDDQRGIFDDFVERINLDQEEDNFYLYIGGNAGTGKSFLLKAMINAAKKRGKRSGAELDKPFSITVAPTGVAAYLVNGTTIESALGIQPSKDKAYIKNEPSRNSSKRFLYEDLRVIFIDEVSMLGTDMLAKMNFRMQDIMGNTEFMGGVSIVCTGDFGQLPPVKQRFVWETSYLDNRLEISPNYWEDHFKIYYLTQKMRSQDDKYSDISDEVRKGNCDETVTEYLRNHVGSCPSENDNEMYALGKFCIIVTSNPKRESINYEKLEKLIPNKKSFYSNAMDKSTNNPNAPKVSENLPLTRTGQLPTIIRMKEGAPVMITSNHDKPKYKNNGIVNGARGYIDSIQSSSSDPDVAEVVWVRFHDDKIGQLLRIDSVSLLKNHKPSDPLSVPITKQKKPFNIKGNTEYLRYQFPLTLCYAVTAHKSQGQTLDEVLIDFTDESRINNGAFYTAMSRVKVGQNLYLKDFKKTYVKANLEVEKKIEAMKIFKKHVFMKTYNTTNIFNSKENELKIGYININDLLASRSSRFINKDKNCLALDYLVLADVRLSKSISNEDLHEELSNWIVVARYDAEDKIKHMGLLMLKSRESIQEKCVENIREIKYRRRNTTQIQVLFSTFPDYGLNVGFLYTRQTPTLEDIKLMKNDLKDCDLLMGDLNLDSNREGDSQKLKILQERRTSVLNEVTTVRFNQLDHIHLDLNKFSTFYATSFINYTSDHHLLSIRIPKDDNKFNESHLQKMSFNVDKETRSKPNEPKRRFPGHKKDYVKANKKMKTEREDFIDLTTKEENRETEYDYQTDINLTCLFSPNWLNDEVINTYLKLLSRHNSNIFMYESQFHTAFLEGGFERVQNYYRRMRVLSFEKIFIPIHNGTHWFLVIFDVDKLTSFDPYNYPGIDGRKKQELIENNKLFHTKLLTNLKDNYFQPLFKKYNKVWHDLAIRVKLPPEIPSQENNHDCGVFLLMFAKCELMNLDFNFDTTDMIHIRDQIREEILTGNTLEHISHGTLGKRRENEDNHLTRKKIKKSAFMQCPQRRIKNPDLETCWLNSCLQLVLTALDFKETISENGSILWQNLIWLQGKDASVPLDPTDVKQVIIFTERERVFQQNVAPSFDFGNLPVFDNEEFRVGRIGQQDCKDFFYCIRENRDVWPDVFDLFSIKTLTETECCNCGHISRQEVSVDNSTLFYLTCPTSEINMKEYLEAQLNGFEQLEDWRDENGCGKFGIGRKRTRLRNIDETDYIIFMLDRLQGFDDQLHIVNTKVTVHPEEEVNLIDKDKKVGKFLPIAIIHHSGSIIEQTTRGHYRADVKNKETETWFRTSDNDQPKELNLNSLTKLGYIFLYKKIFQRQ